MSNMPPAVADFRPGQLTVIAVDGAGWSIETTISQNGAPVDLSGYTFLSQVRSSPESTEVLATLTVTPTNEVGGVITFSQAAASLAVQGCYDLRLTPPAGPPRYMVAGLLIVEPSTSRA